MSPLNTPWLSQIASRLKGAGNQDDDDRDDHEFIGFDGIPFIELMSQFARQPKPFHLRKIYWAASILFCHCADFWNGIDGLDIIWVDVECDLIGSADLYSIYLRLDRQHVSTISIPFNAGAKSISSPSVSTTTVAGASSPGEYESEMTE